MVDKLFGSKTRYKLLELFMSNPNRSFYVREITRTIGEQINSVRRELSNLLSLGIITSDNSGKHLYYEVNQKHEKYEALVSLFHNPSQSIDPKSADKGGKGSASKKAKTEEAKVGPEEKALGNVSLVVLSGAFTRDTRAPVDLLVVGNVTDASLESYIKKLESSIDREIQFAHFDDDDFDYRYKINDRFVSRMLASKLAVRVDRRNLVISQSSVVIGADN